MNTDDTHRATTPQNPEMRLASRLDVVGRSSRTDPVRVKFTLRNLGDRTVHVLTWHTPLEGVMGPVLEISRDGEPVEYRGALAMRIAPTAESYVTLPTDASTETTVELSPSWNLSEPGRYTVSFDGRLLDVTEDASAIPRAMAAHEAFELEPVSVQVRVDAE